MDAEQTAEQSPQTTDIQAGSGVVNSFNEWDPLEEVVVGRLEETIVPQKQRSMLGCIPHKLYTLIGFFQHYKYWPRRFILGPAQRELEEFIHILEAEGVTVRRPDLVDHGRSFATPNWKSRGYTASCPRDCFLVVGDDIITSPMSWRSHYFTADAYYSLFQEYFRKGARWTCAPRPLLADTLFDPDYTVPRDDEEMRFAIRETEIVFDAADFVRCGRDLFVQQSNVTNQAGIEWVRRHLGNAYRVHEIPCLSKKRMHIDTTFLPLAPGKVLVNPLYCDVKALPPILKSWDKLIAPEPVMVNSGWFNETAAMCSVWIHMNVLMLDTERVIVEKSQETMIRALKDWGFKPIPCAFMDFIPFGGAFHCATLDIRRRGGLQSYF